MTPQEVYPWIRDALMVFAWVALLVHGLMTSRAVHEERFRAWEKQMDERLRASQDSHAAIWIEIRWIREQLDKR